MGIRTLEECAENYVDLVKGYAETIQELFPTFEDVLSEKMRLKLRDRREITVELTPELINGEFDYEMYRNILQKNMERINKGKKDLEQSLELFRRKRRPFGSVLETDYQCVDFKRLTGQENLEF